MRKQYTNIGAQFMLTDEQKKRIEAYKNKKDWSLAKTIKNAVIFALEKGFDK